MHNFQIAQISEQNLTCAPDYLCTPKFKNTLWQGQAKEIFTLDVLQHSMQSQRGDLLEQKLKGDYGNTSFQDTEISSLLDIKHKCQKIVST